MVCYTVKYINTQQVLLIHSAYKDSLCRGEHVMNYEMNVINMGNVWGIFLYIKKTKKQETKPRFIYHNLVCCILNLKDRNKVLVLMH